MNSILLSVERIAEIGYKYSGYGDDWIDHQKAIAVLRHALEYLNEACGKHRLVAHSEGEKHIHEFEHRYLCPACMEEINKVVKE
jgi:hypothetical protein